MQIFTGLSHSQLRQPELVEATMGRQALALLRMLDAICRRANELKQAAAEEFRKHRNYAVITS
ncbi:hypothetical protein ACQP1G_26100 [Nocardia sp. CA-107356]|uniref:hypothetical protein n=1 Tax=Nocardia sp. CA-107356 TaxID=3239972 RepID=UPI003D8A580E